MTNDEMNYKIQQLLEPLREYSGNWVKMKHDRMISWMKQNLKVEHEANEDYGQTRVSTRLLVRDFYGNWEEVYEQPQDIYVKKPQRTLPYTTDLGFTIPPLDIDQNS